MDGETSYIFSVLALAFACFSLGYNIGRPPRPVREPVEVIVDTARTDEWDSLKRALIAVESEGIDTAYNETSGASGCLQITDIYIAEVNRLLGEDRYCKDDAFDRTKSLEMFEVYQGAKNPNRDIDKAIRLHNPKAGKWYLERVKNAMK